MLKKLGFARSQLLFIAWVALLGIVVVLGVYMAVRVFAEGLVITNLTDQVPWGLWITVDLSSIALSGGAFFLSALVYILGIKRFKPAARLAVFVGLLGYSAALCTLLLDIGRPDRFYHPLIFWNTHSMLWEVSMCIVLYFTVLTLEVFPLITTLPFFDRLPKVRALAKWLHKGAPVLAFMGLFFSMLHQSSLGATYGVVLARPVWFRPTMPLMFIGSAIAAGPALTIALSLLVAWLRGTEVVPRDVLFDIARVSAGVLLIYLYMRFWDASAGNYGYVPLRTEAIQVLSRGEMSLSFWLWEIVLGGIVAAGLMLWSAAKKSESTLFIGAGMAVVGLIMNRWNTTMIGFLTPLTTEPALTYPVVPTYTPAFSEWAVGLGIVAGVILAFTLGMRFLPAFRPGGSHSEAHEHASAD
jgi:molybdopterin-containing oxidoreductase family membrane subunit